MSVADIILLYTKTDTVSLDKKKQASNPLSTPHPTPIPSLDLFGMHIVTINIQIYIITETETP